MSRLFAATPDMALGLADHARGPGGPAASPDARPPSADIDIRTAEPSDRATVRAIIVDAFEGREAVIGRPPEPLSLDVADAIATRTVLIASIGGEPGGVLVAHAEGDGVIDVEVVAVAKAFSGRGVGQAMMRRIERHARRSGARMLTLYTTARVPRNHEFYRQLGFREARRSGMSTFERIHFEKTLIGRVQKAPVEGLYGRRRVHGHKVDAAYDSLALDLARPADLAALFGDRPVRLEVGFGGGEHLLHHARTTPGIGLIGVEPFETGMMRTAAAIQAEGLANVRLYMGDARQVLDWLPDASLDRVDVLYPDPWHKQRHWKRRFISADGLDRLARTVRSGGVVRFASDIPHYVDWTRAHVATHPEFTLEADLAEPWQDWPGTRYEAKAYREGRVPRYLTLVRR
ncbi:GNAT family N-acetyltransferase [Acuticoccus sediminis]|uniref:GNAT family N-acetyltransferase n=1 Tax=Acuticoccus sediminis TaxID=2184697 RepID=UPI001390E983|nr:GNAT family N-acetyltransferase [Acuticoccus sediminis]